MNRFYLPVLIAILFSCNGEKPKEIKAEEKQSVQHQNSPNEITYRTVFDEEIGWGYQVFRGAHMEIEQRHIPAIQGMRGFETEEKAEKTVKYLIQKIEKGDPRPTLSVDELDSLGVL